MPSQPLITAHRRRALQPVAFGQLATRPLEQPMTAPRESSASLDDAGEQRLSDVLLGLIIGAAIGASFALWAVRWFAGMAA